MMEWVSIVPVIHFHILSTIGLLNEKKSKSYCFVKVVDFYFLDFVEATVDYKA